MTMATTRQIFSSWNLTLVSIEPFVVKFGTCYDNLEWWQAQDGDSKARLLGPASRPVSP